MTHSSSQFHLYVNAALVYRNIVPNSWQVLLLPTNTFGTRCVLPIFEMTQKLTRILEMVGELFDAAFV